MSKFEELAIKYAGITVELRTRRLELQLCSAMEVEKELADAMKEIQMVEANYRVSIAALRSELHSSHPFQKLSIDEIYAETERQRAKLT